jgi:hypothetical protein
MFSLFNLYHPFLTESGAAAVSRANSPAVKCDERKKKFFFFGWGSKFGHVRGIGDWPLQQPISEVGEKLFLPGVKIRTCPDYWLLHSASAHQWSECEENIFVGGPNLDKSGQLVFALFNSP